MGIPIFTVDAFTDRAFAGNPAAVCLLEHSADVGWMQSVAREMNLSETSFLTPHEGDGFDLRWFTPTRELSLCGHGTLAAAHALWDSGVLDAQIPIRFHTMSGVLTASHVDGWIELDFPAKPVEAAKPPSGLIGALGVEPGFVGRNGLDYLVEVSSADQVRSAVPDFAQLGRVDARGTILTSRATPNDDYAEEVDFVSRFFAPGVGIAEDPVTGSAHCALAPYWAAKLRKPDLVGQQVSLRGGTVRARCVGDRVLLGGRAVLILRGVLVAASD